MSRKKVTSIEKKISPLGARINAALISLDANQTQFARSIGITHEYLSRLIYGIGEGGGKFWRGVRRVYPVWEPYLRGETRIPPDHTISNTYRQSPEHMLPKKDREAPDSGPGQLRLPQELSGYRVVEQIIPEEGHRKRLHAKLDEVLQSGNIGLIAAITCNLEEFARSAQKDRILETIGRKPGIPPVEDGDNLPERPSPSSKQR